MYVAIVCLRLAHVTYQIEGIDDAKILLGKCLDIMKHVAGKLTRKNLKKSLSSKANYLEFAFGKDEIFFQDCVDLCDVIHGNGHCHLGFAIALRQLGDRYRAKNNLTEAEEMYRRSFKMKRQLDISKELCLAEASDALHDLANNAMAIRALDVGEGLFRESLEGYRSLEAENKAEVRDEDISKAVNCVARAFIENYQFVDAEGVLNEYKNMLHQMPGEEDPIDFCIMLLWQGSLALKMGEIADAQHYLTSRKEMLERMYGYVDHKSVAITLYEMGRVALARGDLEEAEKLSRKSWLMRLRLFGNVTKNEPTADSLHEMARVIQAKGDLNESGHLRRECYEMRAHQFGVEKDHTSIVESLHLLASIQFE